MGRARGQSHAVFGLGRNRRGQDPKLPPPSLKELRARARQERGDGREPYAVNRLLDVCALLDESRQAPSLAASCVLTTVAEANHHHMWLQPTSVRDEVLDALHRRVAGLYPAALAAAIRRSDAHMLGQTLAAMDASSFADAVLAETDTPSAAYARCALSLSAVDAELDRLPHAADGAPELASLAAMFADDLRDFDEQLAAGTEQPNRVKHLVAAAASLHDPEARALTAALPASKHTLDMRADVERVTGRPIASRETVVARAWTEGPAAPASLKGLCAPHRGYVMVTASVAQQALDGEQPSTLFHEYVHGTQPAGAAGGRPWTSWMLTEGVTDALMARSSLNLSGAGGYPAPRHAVETLAGELAPGREELFLHELNAVPRPDQGAWLCARAFGRTDAGALNWLEERANEDWTEHWLSGDDVAAQTSALVAGPPAPVAV